jgi:hypothetical protein
MTLPPFKPKNQVGIIINGSTSQLFILTSATLLLAYYGDISDILKQLAKVPNWASVKIPIGIFKKRKNGGVSWRSKTRRSEEPRDSSPRLKR